MKYAIGPAFKIVASEFASEDEYALELGLPSFEARTGHSLTIRWGKYEVAPNVTVSNAVRVDVLGDRMRIMHLVPSNNPTPEERQQMPDEEMNRREYKPAYWNPLISVDIRKLTENGDLPPEDIAHWIGVAKNYAKPYFDQTNHEEGKTSDPQVDAKRITYPQDPDQPENPKIYIQFKS